MVLGESVSEPRGLVAALPAHCIRAALGARTCELRVCGVQVIVDDDDIEEAGLIPLGHLALGVHQPHLDLQLDGRGDIESPRPVPGPQRQYGAPSPPSPCPGPGAGAPARPWRGAPQTGIWRPGSPASRSPPPGRLNPGRTPCHRPALPRWQPRWCRTGCRAPARAPGTDLGGPPRVSETGTTACMRSCTGRALLHAREEGVGGGEVVVGAVHLPRAGRPRGVAHAEAKQGWVGGLRVPEGERARGRVSESTKQQLHPWSGPPSTRTHHEAPNQRPLAHAGGAAHHQRRGGAGSHGHRSGAAGEPSPLFGATHGSADAHGVRVRVCVAHHQHHTGTRCSLTARQARTAPSLSSPSHWLPGRTREGCELHSPGLRWMAVGAASHTRAPRRDDWRCFFSRKSSESCLCVSIVYRRVVTLSLLQVAPSSPGGGAGEVRGSGRQCGRPTPSSLGV
jgi:hypothetical protein